MPELTTRYGVLNVPDTSSDLIGRFLLRYGEWAYDEVSFVASALRTSQSRVCDIGAYLGTFGLGLAERTSLGTLVFVEPNPAVLPSLRVNARLAAGIEPIVLDAAVGAAEDHCRATYDPNNFGSMSFAVGPGRGRVEAAFDVPRVSLAQLRQEYGPFDLVKIDAEGLEAEILTSDVEGLHTEDCAYWLECNEDESALEVCDVLLEAGLRLHYFAFPSYSPDNFLKSPSPILPCAFEAGLWASRGQPPELEPALAAHGCVLVHIMSREDLRVALWRTPRFGMPEWEGASPTVLAALAGRALRGDDWESFPTGALPPLTRPAELRRMLAETEAALAIEQNANIASRVELTETREAVTRAERIRAAAELLLAHAQEQAWRSEDWRRAAEARAAVAEAHAAATEARAAAIEANVIWRAIAAIRMRIVARPALRRYLRAVLRLVWRTGRKIFGRKRFWG